MLHLHYLCTSLSIFCWKESLDCLLILAIISRYTQKVVVGVLNLLSTGSKLVCFFILTWLLFCLLLSSDSLTWKCLLSMNKVASMLVFNTIEGGIKIWILLKDKLKIDPSFIPKKKNQGIAVWDIEKHSLLMHCQVVCHI
jgi:hypothetical protein